MSRILVVEDDLDTVEIIGDGLKLLDAGIEHAGTLEEARRKLNNASFGLIIVDVGLPDGTGLDLCREIRRLNPNQVILILSSHSSELDRILGLELGADDYVCKPFSPRELAARARVLLNRSRQLSQLGSSQRSAFGPLVIDISQCRCWVDDAEIKLTAAEFQILSFLAANEGKVVSRQSILESALECPATSDNSLIVLMSKLRKKLAGSKSYRFIETVKGLGYRFVRP